LLTSSYFVAQDITTSWARYGAVLPAASWHADCSSYKIAFYERGDGGVTTYIDAIEAYAGSIPTPGWCGSDTDTSTVCTSTIPTSTPSPISANGALTIRLSAWSPWAGTELAASKYILADGLFSAANTLVLGVLASTDEPAYYIDDTASAALYIESSVLNWAAETEYDLQIERNGLGGMGLYWNSAWNLTTAGAGTGYRSAAQSTLRLGGEAEGGDMWTWGYKVFRRVKR